MPSSASVAVILSQNPIGTLVGTTEIAAKCEDVSLGENLGMGARGVLISPGIQCRASHCTINVDVCHEALLLGAERPANFRQQQPDTLLSRSINSITFVSAPQRHAWHLPVAFVPTKLLLKARLSIGGSRQGAHWSFEFSAAKGANPDCGGAAQPFHNPDTALAHGRAFEPCLADL
jgi:hypothetical protein